MSNPLARTVSLAPLVVLALLVGCSSASSNADATASEAAAGTAEVAVKLGDETITLAEVDEKSRTISLQPYQALYDQRKMAIDQLVAERLIEKEAKSRGLTAEELVEAEISAKMPELTEVDVERFYNQNTPSMGGRQLDDNLRAQIRQFLDQQRVMVARQNFLVALRADTDVAILLEPPRVELTVKPDEPSDGPVDAPVTIVEYSDFQCPYCARVGPTLDQIKQAYGDRVRIVFRDFPLPNHPQAIPAAQAAKCANEQGKFWDYHDKLFASQRELGPDKYKQFAVELGLDSEKFDACVDSNKYAQQVQLIATGGQQAGVTGTPAFFVNGRFVSGAKPFEAFKEIIDEELAN
ncbi:MAG TPA: thioredoxin domain-containing protein [Candidatus Polarisedimenticolaceae bacterium]|nr:thioredoxin domain-containing protein [Candidatus Polarisedimenticolaceae bacterium]